MRKWEEAFRRASFRGARFWVDEDGPEVGRRVAVMDVSGGEVPVVEDMGRIAPRFSVTAYVASDAADAEGLSLEAACQRPGPGLLRLPMDASQAVFCEGCRRSRRKDRNGIVAYDLVFVTAGGSPLAAGSALAVLRQGFAAGLGTVAAAIAGAF